MFFAQETLDKLNDGVAGLTAKRIEVYDSLLARDYAVTRAKEFATHGVSRRLRTMAHCIERVFAILPPEREDHPSMDELVDAVTYIQAFIFNCFACLDNLAWIWVCEQQLTTDRGETIPAGWVGLGKKYRVVRQSLPQDFRKHLKSLDKWFAHLENFRHALAHRIPLYIPPAVLREQDVAQYQLLELQIAKARRKRNQNRYERLKAAQEALTRYQPEMVHSPEDKSKRIVFHPQILSDFETVCDLAKRMNTALDTEPCSTIKREFWRRIFWVEALVGRLAQLFRPSNQNALE
jgi:hypothetical protein